MTTLDPTAQEYSRADRQAVAIAQQTVSDAVLPLLAGADNRNQAFLIAMSAASAAIGLAGGAFAALHDLDMDEIDDLVLAEEVLKMMREVRTQ